MVRLIRDLTANCGASSTPRPTNSPYLRKHWLSAVNVPNVERLMSDWPTALTGALADAITIGKARRKSLKSIASTSAEIATCFENARNVVNVQSKIVTQANQRSRVLSADSVSNLARALEINNRTAQRLRYSQRWKAHVFELSGFPSGSSLITAVRAVVKATIPFEMAAKALMSPKLLLAIIVEGGHLPYFRYGLIYKYIRLWQNDIDELVERLRASAIFPINDELQVLRLADLLAVTKIKSARWLPSSTCRLIDGILSGQVPLLRLKDNPETFYDLGLPVEYVSQVLNRRVPIPLERIILARRPTRVK